VSWIGGGIWRKIMSNENTEILMELKGIRQELHTLNETLYDLSYLSQLEEINNRLLELNPSYQKMMEDRKIIDDARKQVFD
jgi:hypothetical protein